ncbi:MAG: hypothetical protein H0X37_09010 [Herpetosiphonaceae bacterium]|nr:hypothetical protein [Herpetosiphonaceae bacterium]
MELTLTPDIEHALREQAQQQGIAPERLALDSLRRQFVRPVDITQPTENTETLADFLADFIGVLHSSEYIPGGARLSEATGKTFTDILIKKRQQGQL